MASTWTTKKQMQKFIQQLRHCSIHTRSEAHRLSQSWINFQDQLHQQGEHCQWTHLSLSKHHRSKGTPNLVKKTIPSEANQGITDNPPHMIAGDQRPQTLTLTGELLVQPLVNGKETTLHNVTIPLLVEEAHPLTDSVVEQDQHHHTIEITSSVTAGADQGSSLAEPACNLDQGVLHHSEMTGTGDPNPHFPALQGPENRTLIDVMATSIKITHQIPQVGKIPSIEAHVTSKGTTHATNQLTERLRGVSRPQYNALQVTPSVGRTHSRGPTEMMIQDQNQQCAALAANQIADILNQC